MIGAVLERLLAECDGCGQPILRTLPPVRVLDPEPSPGGLYQVDERGRVHRRELTTMFTERRLGVLVDGGGYEPHECSKSAAYARRFR